MSDANPNVHSTSNVLQIKGASEINVTTLVWERAHKMHCAKPSIIAQFAIVHRDKLETRSLDAGPNALSTQIAPKTKNAEGINVSTLVQECADKMQYAMSLTISPRAIVLRVNLETHIFHVNPNV